MQFDKYSVIPHHEKVYIDNFDVPEGEHRTFVFEVLIKGEKKHYGEVCICKQKCFVLSFNNSYMCSLYKYI